MAHILFTSMFSLL